MAFFDLVLKTSGSLHSDGEPDDFISEHIGLIRYTRNHDGRVFKVGKVKACRIHADLARQAGESIFDVCDAHSQEMHEVYVTLFDPATDDLKEAPPLSHSGLVGRVDHDRSFVAARPGWTARLRHGVNHGSSRMASKHWSNVSPW
jgi:hypothetical protein